jgi:hypothetical protein
VYCLVIREMALDFYLSTTIVRHNSRAGSGQKYVYLSSSNLYYGNLRFCRLYTSICLTLPSQDDRSIILDRSLVSFVGKVKAPKIKQLQGRNSPNL